MKVRVGAAVLELKEGDITRQRVDGIVNAANSRLAGGGGVDGAIHRAGGETIMEECRRIGSCPTGQAVVTGAGRLKAKKVIHAVGPIYHDGHRGEASLLSSAYASAFNRAVENGLTSVATPSLSTGAYGYPIDEAARVALSTALDFLKGHPGLELVRFVLFGEEAYGVYERTLKELTAE